MKTCYKTELKSLMTNRKWAVVCLFLLVLALVSCGERHSIRKQLEEFESHKITVPKIMLVYENGTLRAEHSPLGYRYIVYFSSEECSACALSHLEKYSDVFHLGDSLGFSPMLILSPSEEEMQMTRGLLEKTSFPFPVWFDADKSFCLYNAHIPSDTRFHSFLINAEGAPIVVGNPSNKAVRHLVKEQFHKSRNRIHSDSH